MDGGLHWYMVGTSSWGEVVGFCGAVSLAPLDQGIMVPYPPVHLGRYLMLAHFGHLCCSGWRLPETTFRRRYHFVPGLVVLEDSHSSESI